MVRTAPSLGKTRFELDGMPMMTVRGALDNGIHRRRRNFGNFIARFDQPGWHTVTVIDETRQEMLVANSYQDAYALNETVMPGATSTAPRDPERLGKHMDPSEPGKVSAGKPFKFAGWDGPVKSGKIVRVYVEGDTEVTARFERQ